MARLHLSVRLSHLCQRVGGPNGDLQLARAVQVGELVQQRRGPIGAYTADAELGRGGVEGSGADALPISH